MGRRTLVTLLGFMLCTCHAYAATVIMKDGTAVSGKLLEQTPDRIKLEAHVGKVSATLTLSRDDIAKIEAGEVKGDRRTGVVETVVSTRCISTYCIRPAFAAAYSLFPYGIQPTEWANYGFYSGYGPQAAWYSFRGHLWRRRLRP